MVTTYPKYVLKPANVDLGCYNVIDTPPCSWTFAPVGFSMQQPMVSETQCTIPKFLLVSVEKFSLPLFLCFLWSASCMTCKHKPRTYKLLTLSTVGTKNMLPCEVCTSRTSSEVAANFEQSCCELRAKLLRTSSEVAVNFAQSCAANFERSCCELRAKLCCELRAKLL